MVSSDLAQGRAAVGERRWGTAFERLRRAQSAEDLDAADFEMLACAALLRGEREAAVAALVRAHDHSLDREDLRAGAHAAAWLALYLFQLGDLAGVTEWAPRATALAARLAEPDAVAGLAQVPIAMSQFGGGEARGALARFEEIAELGRRFDDRDLQALAMFGVGKCLTELEEIDRGFGMLDDVVALISSGGVSAVAAGEILCTVVSDALLAFDLDRASEWFRVLDRWCAAQPELIAFAGQRHALRAALLLTSGSWRDAAAAAELAVAGWRAGDPRAAFGAPYWYGEVQRLRGAVYSAADAYQRAGRTMWQPQPGQALLRLQEGDVTGAREAIRRSTAAMVSLARRASLPAVVEIEIAAGDVAAARRAVDELDASAGSRTPLFAAVVAHARAQAQLAEGDAAGAVTTAEDAEKRWRDVGAGYDAARSALLLGRALTALGRTAAARAAFDRARETFVRLDAAPASAELAAAEGRRRSGSLTERELEVLRLLATGATNRAIAARLTISEKTVARHLSNIFDKLDVATRSAATAYAYENGLV